MMQVLVFSAKLCYSFEEKLFFSANIILWKKGMSKNEQMCLYNKEGWGVG